MDEIEVGNHVRFYYDPESFDEGQVCAVSGGQIEVDFYDWVERWPSADRFKRVGLYLEGKEVLVPLGWGEIVKDFRRT